MATCIALLVCNLFVFCQSSLKSFGTQARRPHLRYVDTWLSFQVLFAHTAFEIFEHTLYDVTVKLYKAFQRVVSYQVVPEAWCREVATLALQS